MDDKKISRMKKLQALAERGVGGEKETATAMLENLLAKNDMSDLAELETDKKAYFFFSYNGLHEHKLLFQCMYKAIGQMPMTYLSEGKINKISVYCTKAQKIEIELDFDFYKKALSEEIDKFVDAFILAQNIFPENTSFNKITLADLNPDDLARLKMKAAIKKRSRSMLIGESI